jgi:hypothetical protein
MGNSLRAWPKPEKKAVLFLKKNQKPLLPYGAYLVQHARQVAKAFASFFKKKRFLAVESAKFITQHP